VACRWQTDTQRTLRGRAMEQIFLPEVERTPAGLGKIAEQPTALRCCIQFGGVKGNQRLEWHQIQSRQPRRAACATALSFRSSAPPRSAAENPERRADRASWLPGCCQGLEVGLNIVLGTEQPRLESGDERVIAHLQQYRGAPGLLHNCRRSSGNQGFFRDPVEVSTAPFNIGTGLVDFLPGRFWKHRPPSALH